jgi:low affinity Fe/Cu permease
MTRFFADTSTYIARQAGRPIAFVLAVLIVLIWGLSGPYFGYSDTWQLVINTGTTIVTFLMVFIIQNTQNRDGAAVQAKLDELIRVGAAHNTFIGIEHLTDEEIEGFKTACALAAERTAKKKGRANPKTR